VCCKTQLFSWYLKCPIYNITAAINMHALLHRTEAHGKDLAAQRQAWDVCIMITMIGIYTQILENNNLQNN
jgi:hypothetical protein